MFGTGVLPVILSEGFLALAHESPGTQILRFAQDDMEAGLHKYKLQPRTARQISYSYYER